MDLAISLVNALPKRQNTKSIQKYVTLLKVHRSKYQNAEQNNDRSNNLSAGFTEHKKKSTHIHLVTDDGDTLETRSRENIPWLDYIDIYPDTQKHNYY